MEKLFTVVIATYNAARTVERALQSVVRQKTDDVQLIIVDGASKDDTMDIVNRYSDDIDVIISEPDKGVYDAWNKALRRADGEWIMFLGADDYYVDGVFRQYRDFLRDNSTLGVDLISAKCCLINHQGAELRVFGAPYRWEEFRNKNRLSHGSALHNRKLFSEVGCFDLNYRISADYELLLRKPLKTLFMDAVVIYMEEGGMSYSAAGLFQTFRVKRHRHSSNIILDLYYLVKGLTGFYLRKAIWRITK